MQTTPLALETLARSVWAVPPLARTSDGTIDPAANAAIAGHIEAGGLSTLLYGGNAVFYHLSLREFETACRVIADAAASETLVIPAIGPAYGTMLDQVAVLRDMPFPTAMVLPQRDVVSSAGLATGVRRVVESYGRPIVLYLKFPRILDIPDVRRLVDEGLVSAIKWAVVRDDHTQDEELRELVDAVDPRMILSGLGDQPAIVHMRDFGLGGFTTGTGCVAPRMSRDLLAAIRAEDWDRAETIREAFLPLEDLRNAYGPISVLHTAVELAGIAPTGPLPPLLQPIPAGDLHDDIAAAVRSLDEFETTLAA